MTICGSQRVTALNTYRHHKASYDKLQGQFNLNQAFARASRIPLFPALFRPWLLSERRFGIWNKGKWTVLVQPTILLKVIFSTSFTMVGIQKETFGVGKTDCAFHQASFQIHSPQGLIMNVSLCPSRQVDISIA